MTFSQRMGLKPVRTLIQRESADTELRNALWNGLIIFYLRADSGSTNSNKDELNALLRRVWFDHYKERIDEFPQSTSTLTKRVKADFIGKEWNVMFDILEFFPENFEEVDKYGEPTNTTNEGFFLYTNHNLEKHLSAYRFVDGLIVEITSQEEIESIEDTLNNSNIITLKSVNTHVRRALEMYADRNSPDYRNSIKESISSIESLSKLITQNPNATLGQALKTVEREYGLHPALKDAFSKLYGYTNDSDGIRHALLDESSLHQEDAKFMLVTCSAFINYLLVKTKKKQ